MEFQIVEVFKRSVTAELVSDRIFEQDAEFDVYINGEKSLRTAQNVFSVMGLTPDTRYLMKVVAADGSFAEKEFVTEHESVLLDVTEFGAVGDGKTPATAAIQAAISCCPKDGCVYLPKGDYYCSPLFLKSNMTLWIGEGARILGDTDRNHYPVLPGMTMTTDEKGEFNLGTWEGNPLDMFLRFRILRHFQYCPHTVFFTDLRADR